MTNNYNKTLRVVCVYKLNKLYIIMFSVCYFMHTIQLIHYYVTRHHTVWVVHDQLRIVKRLTRFPKHAVTAVRRTREFLLGCEYHVFLPRENVH